MQGLILHLGTRALLVLRPTPMVWHTTDGVRDISPPDNRDYRPLMITCQDTPTHFSKSFESEKS